MENEIFYSRNRKHHQKTNSSINDMSRGGVNNNVISVFVNVKR